MSELEQARWVELYAKLEKPMYNVVYRVIWDAAESQDLVQEAFLRCWQRRARVRADGVKALLFRTALNLALNRRRRLKLWRFVGLDSVVQKAHDDGLCDRIVSRRVREALDALPERSRKVLLLTELAGMTYGEVARTLGIGEGTVGSRRTRALAQLRRELDSGEDHAEMKLEDGTLL